MNNRPMPMQGQMPAYQPMPVGGVSAQPQLPQLPIGSVQPLPITQQQASTIPPQMAQPQQQGQPGQEMIAGGRKSTLLDGWQKDEEGNYKPLNETDLRFLAKKLTPDVEAKLNGELQKNGVGKSTGDYRKDVMLGLQHITNLLKKDKA